MRRFLRVLAFIAIGALALGAVGFVVMSLWNALAPAAFGGHLITFWQALGLFVLARLLVGGLRRGGGWHRRGWRGMHGGMRNGHWRRRMAARWESMSDDERERFQARFAGRCGRGPRVDPAGGSPA